MHEMRRIIISRSGDNKIYIYIFLLIKHCKNEEWCNEKDRIYSQIKNKLGLYVKPALNNIFFFNFKDRKHKKNVHPNQISILLKGLA